MIGYQESLFGFDDLSRTVVHYWTSDWGSEWTPCKQSATTPLDIAVVAGRSSKGHHPFIIIENGQCAYFLGVAWSGNWHITINPSGSQLAITVESDSEDLEVFTTSVDSGGVDLAMRKFITNFRKLDSHQRPKLLTEWNSWWPYEDAEINEAILMENAAIAQLSGIETVVLDAGWFGPSQKDSYWHHLRGDWNIRNLKRFPSGLEKIGELIRALGLEFGIWLEVEALGENAQLAIDRPDFIARRDGKALGYICLGNPAALVWAIKTSQDLIHECQAAWVKLDFNVDPGDGCNRGDHVHQSVLGLNGHINGLYQLLDTLTKNNPDLTVENCSSGGLRWDLGIAQHVDCGFASDPDWPEHALASFWAASLFFPVEKLLGWCDSQWRGDHPHQLFNASTSPDSDLEFSLAITLLGGFGISARLPEFSSEKRRLLTEYVALYKSEFRPRFQSKAFIRHLSAQPERELAGCRTVAFAIESEGFNPIVVIYQLEGKNRLPQIRYAPPNSLAHYRVRDLRSQEIVMESGQGEFIFENNLLNNSARMLIFEKVSA